MGRNGPRGAPASAPALARSISRCHVTLREGCASAGPSPGPAEPTVGLGCRVCKRSRSPRAAVPRAGEGKAEPIVGAVGAPVSAVRAGGCRDRGSCEGRGAQSGRALWPVLPAGSGGYQAWPFSSSPAAATPEGYLQHINLPDINAARVENVSICGVARRARRGRASVRAALGIVPGSLISSCSRTGCLRATACPRPARIWFTCVHGSPHTELPLVATLCYVQKILLRVGLRAADIGWAAKRSAVGAVAWSCASSLLSSCKMVSHSLVTTPHQHAHRIHHPGSSQSMRGCPRCACERSGRGLGTSLAKGRTSKVSFAARGAVQGLTAT